MLNPPAVVAEAIKPNPRAAFPAPADAAAATRSARAALAAGSTREDRLMRFGAGWAASGVLTVLLLAAAAPGAAQQAPAGDAPAAAYASQLRDTEARLGRAIEQAQGAGTRTQAGAMPPGQQQLMDATQAAWQAMQGSAPEAMRNSGAYGEADRTFRRAVEAMRVGQTSPDAALGAAREAQAALGRLREAAAAQAGGTGATGASTPSPGTGSQGPIQEPPRR